MLWGLFYAILWVRCPDAFALVSDSEAKINAPRLQGTGVTALHFVDVSKNMVDAESSFVFASTKKGTIRPYCLSRNGLLEPVEEELKDPSLSKFPVFSMTSTVIDRDTGLFQLICGGGNRFISIWSCSKEGKFEFFQHLGPHTGWVRDVAYDRPRGVIHSIGCNCIESWKLDYYGDDKSWSHAKKRLIASCPKYGSTLSSDLLSLCIDEGTDLLYSGGVDGRIHAWSGDLSISSPIQSIVAHKGRVNVLELASKARMLFSAGHDGTLQCRLVDSENSVPEKPDAMIEITNSSGETLRVTSAACLSDMDGLSASVVIGTANGVLRRVAAKRTCETPVSLSSSVSRDVCLEGEPMINAICGLPTSLTTDDEAQHVMIGHANGMTQVCI